MSLQTRIVALVSAMLLVSITLGAVFAGFQARRSLHDELQAGMTGGEQTVRRAFEDLPRSDHPSRDLTQLVETFDGSRHVAASLIDGKNRRIVASRPALSAELVPAWFRRLMDPVPRGLSLAVPGSVGGFKAILLRPTPQSDLSATWSELSSVVAVLGVSAAAGLVLVFLVIGATLAPLRELSARFDQIGSGDYRGRVRERGPIEIMRLEQRFNAMSERLAAMGERNGALEQQLLKLQDEERADLARDLHDEIGPHLFAVSVDAQLITQLLSAGRQDEIHGQVDTIQATVTHVQREIRGMLARLRPARVTELGLDRAIMDLIRFWQGRRSEIEFNTSLLSDEAQLDDELKDTAFRIVQECINNAVKHARPTRIDVIVTREDRDLLVRVHNDGVVPGEGGKARGFGIVGMRERVQSWGGQLTVQPARRPDEPWSVTAHLPVTGKMSAARKIEALA